MALTIFLAQQNSVIMGNRKFKLGRHNKNEEIRSNPKKVGRPKKIINPKEFRNEPKVACNDASQRIKDIDVSGTLPEGCMGVASQ
jgi:hypothetical protein